MPPEISPSGLFLVIRSTTSPTIGACARAAGISHRQVLRLIELDWGYWRLRYAEDFCRHFGYDFWNLHFTPKMMAAVDWLSKDPLVLLTLRMMFARKHGRPPTHAEIRSFREAMRTLRCGDPG